jgi:methylphosphotriester-DNA--protein-cysteine methyltransferase
VTTRVEQGLDILEGFLRLRLTGVQIDSRVTDALQKIERCAGQVRVTQLAKDCQVSVRNLDRLFRTWVGFSPKWMARISRFQVLLQKMETSRGGGSADLAAELGYYDQSHLANEVAQFAGARATRLATRHLADFSKTRCE